MPLTPRTLEEVLASLLVDINGAAHASVARSGSDGLTIVTSTDWRIDEGLRHDDGPPAAALHFGRISRIPSTRNCAEFPAYGANCNALGIRSVGAFPIRDFDRVMVGVLIVTSHDHHGFGTDDLRTARAAAAEVAARLIDLGESVISSGSAGDR